MEQIRSTLERKPIIPNAAHCARALAFIESGGIYFALGKTSEWEGEKDADFIPPEPDPNATTLDELIGMKKADRVTMVVPDENGDIIYANQKFKALNNEEALEQRSRWVLVESTIYYEELPAVEYRQIGIFSRVKPKAGKESGLVLLPENIEDVGILEVLQNRKVVTRQSDTRDKYFMIIEM